MRSFNKWAGKRDFEYGASAVFLNNDDDADYKPILRGVINTRCNYDGAKIEGSMED